VSTSTLTGASHSHHVRKAARWVLAASVFFALRVAIFGLGVTPSLVALFGLDSAEALGPIPSSRIDLLDLALLVAIAAATTMALVNWLRQARG